MLCDQWWSDKKDDVIDSANGKTRQVAYILHLTSYSCNKLYEIVEKRLLSKNKIKEHLCEVPTLKKNTVSVKKSG